MEFAGAQAFSVHPKETIIVKDSNGYISIKRIGDFADKFIDKIGKGVNEIDYVNIGNYDFFTPSFNEEGIIGWKKITKVVRHAITDPLHIVKTNKGMLTVSKNHSVFSLEKHTYLGGLESKILSLCIEQKQLDSRRFDTYSLKSKKENILRAISQLKMKNVVKNRSIRRKDGTISHAIYTPVIKNNLICYKTDELKCSNEIKSKEVPNNIAVLSNIDLEQKSHFNLYKFLVDHPELIDNVYVYGKFDLIKNSIMKSSSLREESIKLEQSHNYLHTCLTRNYLPFDLYEKFKTGKEEIKLGKTHEEKKIDTIIEGDYLRNLIKLIAWYISEGWAINETTVGITQSKEENITEIKQILDDLEITQFEQNTEKENYLSKSKFVIGGFWGSFINRTCGKYCDNKKIPSFILSLDNHLKEIFVNELIKGDGYKKPTGKAYVSTSNLLITGLNLILISLGYRTSIKVRFEEDFENYKNGLSTKKKSKLTRYDLTIHDNYETTLNYNDFTSTVIHKNEEFKFETQYEYDLSVEDNETFIGGVGLFALHNSSVDTLLAPFVKKDNLNYIEVKQNIQRLIFGLNVASRWGSQSPFTNLTFDLKAPEDMADEAAIVGGVEQDFTYGDCQKEMDMVNKAFLELYYAGDAKGRIFTFPIPTYNLTKDFDWDSEISDLLFQVTAKYGIPYFQNYLGSNLDPKSIRAMCCRLNIDLNEIMKRPGSMWGPGDNTGSIGVVTINLNRLAYNARNKNRNDLEAAKAEFQNSLRLYMGYAKDSLEIKRKVITQNLENGLMPYTKEYLGSFDNYFSTIGINGSHEACVNLLGEGIQSATGKEFIIETLEFMKTVLQEYQIESGYLFNLEATPAESTAYRFAQKDKELCPGVFVSGTEEAPFLTNSSHLPVDVTDDVWFALEHQNEIQPLYTGGTMFHTFLGEKVNDPQMCKKLVYNIATKTRLPYFSITPTFSICKNCGYITGEHSSCPDCGDECEIFSRIVGYFRPVSNWNKGKKQEFVERTTYSQPQASNLLEINNQVNQVEEPSNGTSTISHSLLNEKGINSYVILTTPSCPNCPQAKELLKNHPMTKDILGTEKNAQVPDEATLGLIKQFNINSVPTVVFFDESDEAIGSYSGIQRIQECLE
jgi:ribonucleoside-triphosphate reductase